MIPSGRLDHLIRRQQISIETYEERSSTRQDKGLTKYSKAEQH